MDMQKVSALLLAGLLCGCNAKTPAVANLAEAGDGDATALTMVYLPLVAQQEDYTCGVAALGSLLTAWGEAYDEPTLARALGTSADGTSYKAIAAYMTAKGYEVAVQANLGVDRLTDSLDLGKPVILLLQAWGGHTPDQYRDDWDDGHFVVATGYSAGRIYVMDPSTKDSYAYVERAALAARWHDVDAYQGQTERLDGFGMTVTAAGAGPRPPPALIDFRTVPRMP